jgi:hypothetical protein
LLRAIGGGDKAVQLRVVEEKTDQPTPTSAALATAQR